MTVEVDITEIHRTERAVLVESADTGREAWVPLSLIKDYTTHVGSEEFTSICISQNLAEEKELV